MTELMDWDEWQVVRNPDGSPVLDEFGQFQLEQTDHPFNAAEHRLGSVPTEDLTQDPEWNRANRAGLAR